jgi:hypothetical protein
VKFFQQLVGGSAKWAASKADACRARQADFAIDSADDRSYFKDDRSS